MLEISQERLARSIGVTFQQIQKYEKGQNRIGASRLLQLARALKTPVAAFFEEAPGGDGRGADNVVPMAALLATPEAIQLQTAFNRIDDVATRRRIVELVQTLSHPAAGNGDHG